MHSTKDFISDIDNLLFILCIITLPYTVFSKSKIASTGVHTAMHELPLKNEDYWGAPASKLNDFTWDLLNAGTEKILIDCPDFIPISVKQTFPVCMVGIRNISVTYKKDFEGKTFGVCTNLETGKTYIGSVHRTPDVTSDITPSPGLVVQDYLINLRNFLGIPWEVATYKIWFVYYDLLSNGMKCRLSADEASYETKEEEKYLIKVMQQSQRKDLFINKAVFYTKEPITPDSELNINILTSSAANKKEWVIIIDGKMPVSPTQKVNREEQTGNLNDVNAIVPLDILIIRTHGNPERFSFGAPIFQKLISKNGNDIGIFQVKISLTELNIPLLQDKEKMFVYAFSGDFSAGPGVVE